MKKIIALLLSMMMVLSMAACGKKDGDGGDSQSGFQRGTIENGIYTNTFVGIGCQLSDDWTYYTDEQLAELSGVVAESSEEMQKAMEDGKSTYDMFASAMEGLVTINVVYEDLGALYGKLLDEAGWTECQISVSNSLDEYLIQDLLLQDAKIDLFGVGERMITAKSEPVFGGVYKLVAIEEPDGTVIPKIKVSENVEKITIPHFKKVYRLFGRDTGKAIADYITVHDETVDDTKGLTIFDPMATWKRKDVYNFEARELLVPIFKNGKRVYDCPPLEEIKAYCAQQVDTLWDEVKRFDYPHKYYVDLSDKLWDIQQCLLRTSQM